ncbi:MAG: protease complex subunit PrcB family protein [Candidatus Kapaibacterium sp.]
MKRHLILIAVIISGIVLNSCNKFPPGPDPEPVPIPGIEFETYYQGSHFYMNETDSPIKMVIKNENDEEVFLNSVTTPPTFAPVDLPDIYDDRMYIAIIMPQRPSGGYELDIRKVFVRNNTLYVKAVEIEPEVGDASIGYPGHIIRLERMDMPLNFLDIELIKE